MSLTDAWKQWLDDPARTGTSPFALVEAAVAEVAPEGASRHERLLRGEQNEVYAVTTSTDRELIVRISRRPSSPFPGERWIIESLRAAGVPTPKVLLVQDFTDRSEPVSICIQERLPGIPLADLVEGSSALGEGERHRYAIECGRMLRRIHSVPTNGYGFLDAEGSGAEENWGEFLTIPVRHRDRFASAATSGGLTLDEFDAALLLLHAGATRLAGIAPSVVHQDFLSKHVLVKDDDIVGVIDFEVSRGGDGLYDLAIWDLYHGIRFPLDWFLQGYAPNPSDLPIDVTDRLWLYKLHFALRILLYSATGFSGFASLAAAAARVALDELG